MAPPPHPHAALKVARMLGEYQAPDLDPGVAEALSEYVAGRKAAVPDSFM